MSNTAITRAGARAAHILPALGTVLILGACATRGTTTAGGDVDLAAMGAMVAESPAVMFADPRIAAVSSSANQDEIQTSQLAVQRAQNAQVRQFAEMMVQEHGRLEQQAQSMLAEKRMVPVDNALSVQRKRNLQVMLDTLRSLSGAAFDREYVLHQIASHMMTLHTLDTSLIPQAQDPQLRTMLQQQVRPAVAAHLQQIKQIHQTLMGGTSGSGTP